MRALVDAFGPVAAFASALAFAVGLAAGCRPAAELPPPPEDPGPFTLRVDPQVIDVVTGPDGAEPVPFVATAVYESGEERALDLVDWTLSNRSAGVLDETGLFTPSNENGGVSWVTARLDGVEGTATVHVSYRETQNPEGIDETLFFEVPEPVTGRWAYPEDGVNFPRNTPSIAFQWDPAGAVASRIVFRSELTELWAYTAGAGWTADGETWGRIASTNAGGTVEVTLTFALPDGRVVEEAPRTFTVNRMDAAGAILYWSTSVSGFVEIPFGGAASNYLTFDQTGRCQGCHAISSTGLVAFSYDGGDGALAIKRVDDKSDVTANAGIGNFKAFSPDGRFLLATDHGALNLHDGATGALIGAVRAQGDATHVDWSPDGAKVAITLTDGHEADWSIAGDTRIAVMEHLGDGVFSDPVVVVDPAGLAKAYYPAWSPDGQWLAYDVSNGDCYDDADAELWVVDRDAARPPVRLAAANTDTIELTNSWPRWGPLPDDEVLWLAFASRRPYGFVTAETPQIWVAGFDPAKAEQGVDPSWPAFWLPGQDSATANHIPLWIP